MVTRSSLNIQLVLCVSALIAVCFATSNAAAADSTRFTHSVKSMQEGVPALGTDFWFSMPESQNVGGGNGTYYMLYVSSPEKTTVRISVTGSTPQPAPLQPGQVLPFAIPLGWEVTTSGEVENKVIHVWSEPARNLSVHFLSRNPATSDGATLVPATGWGKDYVVAAYHSLYELTFDYPSEFMLVSNQPNTEAVITPTQNIRKTRQAKEILHGINNAFTELLGEGQCVQYQLTEAKNSTDWDVTGTTITSNHNVGVLGGSQCANIPSTTPYCDHICEMIPPVRSWGRVYYSAPFVNRKGGDSFCFIGSKNGQVIYRTDSESTGAVECIVDKYRPFFDPAITNPTRFYSSEPFFLAQYCNSTDFPTPGSNNGVGDPAMTCITAVEQFEPKVFFQTPTITGAQTPFQNYVHVAVKSGHAAATTFDGVPLQSVRDAAKFKVDGLYEMWRLPKIAAGSHTLASDAGASVMAYGYGSYECYAWPGHIGNKWIDIADTSHPKVSYVNTGDTTRVTLTTSGAAGLIDYGIDSTVNLRLLLPQDFVVGEPRTSVTIAVTSIDRSKDGLMSWSVLGNGGVRTHINTTYFASNVIAKDLSLPESQTFPTIDRDDSVSQEILLTNRSTLPKTISGVWLDDSSNWHLAQKFASFNLDRGATKLIKVWDAPKAVGNMQTNLRVRASDGDLATCILYGTARTRGVFTVDQATYDFGSLTIDSTRIQNITIKSLSKNPVEIVSAMFYFGRSFAFAPPLAVPFTIAADGSVTVAVAFAPDSVRAFVDSIRFVEAGGFSKTVALFGNGLPSFAAVQPPTQSSLDEWLSASTDQLKVFAVGPNPVATANPTLTFGTRASSIVRIEVYDMLGRLISSSSDRFSPGLHQLPIDLQSLPAGSYQLSISSLEETVTRTLIKR